MHVTNGTLLLCPCEKQHSVKPSRIRFPKWSQSCTKCKKLHCCHERCKRAHFLRFVTQIMLEKNQFTSGTWRFVVWLSRLDACSAVQIRLIFSDWEPLHMCALKKTAVLLSGAHHLLISLMHIYSVNKNATSYTLQLGKVAVNEIWRCGASQ